MSTQDPNDPYHLPAAPPEPAGYAAAQQRPVPRGPMPREVNWATILLAVGILLSLISLILVLAGKNSYIDALHDKHPGYSQSKLDDMYSQQRLTSIIGFVIGLVLYSWLIIKIRQGRNWARIVVTVLLVLSILSGLVVLGAVGLGGAKALAVVGLVISIVTVVLLWLRPSNAYFKETPPGTVA